MTNYGKQKQQTFARFRLSQEDANKIATGQFTIYDFINNAFSFSQTNKDLAAKVLEILNARPTTFMNLCRATNAKKSTLYLLMLALERSGFVEKRKTGEFCLSDGFARALDGYSNWWRAWVKN